MSFGSVLLPGEDIPSQLLPRNEKKPLVLGPGLRHAPPGAVKATIAGAVAADRRKNAVWIEHDGGRVLKLDLNFLRYDANDCLFTQYIPHPNDLIIVTVHHSSTDMYHCSITPHTPFANLPQLAFEGATRKTRPQLASGALVYARVSSASGDMDPELSCVSASSGKSEGLGPLKGGMLFDISSGFARRLLMPASKVPLPAHEGGGGVVILEALAEKIGFEVAVGRNRKIWIDGNNVQATIAVGRAVTETDKGALSLEQQRKLAAKVLRDSGG